MKPFSTLCTQRQQLSAVFWQPDMQWIEQRTATLLDRAAACGAAKVSDKRQPNRRNAEGKLDFPTV